MKCEVKHNWDMEMRCLWLNGWGSYGKLLPKNAGLQGSSYPFRSLHDQIEVPVPLNSQPVAYLQRGRDYSPPKACFYLRNPALGWRSQCSEYTVTKQNGGGAQWMVPYLTLTRGMDEPHHYPQR